MGNQGTSPDAVLGVGGIKPPAAVLDVASSLATDTDLGTAASQGAQMSRVRVQKNSSAV